MSVFSDRSIRLNVRNRSIIIDPFDEDLIQPTSYDCRLSDKFLIHNYDPSSSFYPEVRSLEIDLYKIPDNLMIPLQSQNIVLRSKTFMLGSTIERIDLSNRIVARVEGKSSLGRAGLIVHATAGFIDPGFRGNITLELYNLSPHHLILHAGMKICQLCFMTATTSVMRPYGSDGLNSRYQDSEGTIGSRYESSA